MPHTSNSKRANQILSETKGRKKVQKARCVGELKIHTYEPFKSYFFFITHKLDGSLKNTRVTFLLPISSKFITTKSPQYYQLII